MLKNGLPDLTLTGLSYGSHETPLDLSIWLYCGAAAVRRNETQAKILNGELSDLRIDRLELAKRLHEVAVSKISRGCAKATIYGDIRALNSFVAWADSKGTDLTVDNVEQQFREFAEVLLHRVRVTKTIKQLTAYDYASIISDWLTRALRYPGRSPGNVLLRTTVLRYPRAKPGFGAKSDEQNLEATFAFGHLLREVCAGLDAPTIRGSLPIRLFLNGRRELVLNSGLAKPGLNVSEIKINRARMLAERKRAPLKEDESVIEQRSSLLNLRIGAELLIFLSQTGMNLAQAAVLRIENYRWRTSQDELSAFRVFKGRRGGQAVFRCFRAYREHLSQYLDWLDAMGLKSNDSRLFPFIYPTKIPSEGNLPRFVSVRALCKTVGVTYVGPQELRKTRVNWLLRRSGDVGLTSEQSAHTKETLLRYYERPHHQRAIAEIIKFHSLSDPVGCPPGPGVCADSGRGPKSSIDRPDEAPEPDCISPEGCLFCVHHRDVLSFDYCWKLASHARIKTLEIALWRPSKDARVHPAQRVIDRLIAKLRAIAEGSEVRAQWVRDAENSVRAGTFHPHWKAHLVLMETMA